MGSLWSSRWADPPGSSRHNPILPDNDQRRLVQSSGLGNISYDTSQVVLASGNRLEGSPNMPPTFTTTFPNVPELHAHNGLISYENAYSNIGESRDQEIAVSLAPERPPTPGLIAQYGLDVNNDLPSTRFETRNITSEDGNLVNHLNEIFNYTEGTIGLPDTSFETEQSLRSVGNLGLGLVASFPDVVSSAYPPNWSPGQRTSLLLPSAKSAQSQYSLDNGQIMLLAEDSVSPAADRFETSNNASYRPSSYSPETTRALGDSFLHGESYTTHAPPLIDRPLAYSAESSEQRGTSSEASTSALESPDDFRNDESLFFCRRCTRPLEHDDHLAHPEKGFWCYHCIPTDPFRENAQCRLCQRVMLDWEQARGIYCLHCAYDPPLEARVVSRTHCWRCVARLMPGEENWCFHCLPPTPECEGCCDHCGRRMCDWEKCSGALCVHCVVELAEDLLGLRGDLWWG